MDIVRLDGVFGSAEINVASPSLVGLVLGSPRGPTGKSVLAKTGPFPWGRHGCSYVVDTDGVRYESRAAGPDDVRLSRVDGNQAVRIAGVKLAASDTADPVAIEDWFLSAPGDGSDLVWTIERRWQRDCACAWSGSPGLFFSFDNTYANSSVTSTIWHDPLRLTGRPSSTYGACMPGWSNRPRALSKNLFQVVKDRDTWAIYKLWTNWHAPADLRLEVEGGHLYRRGAYAMVSEAGAVTSPAAEQTYRQGQVEQITLRIGAVGKATTGYQLAVTLPDKTMESSLKDFYGSLLNGGIINDQKGFDFGNETDGFYYSGSAWAQGWALAAGVPATGSLSSHPYSAASAFREHLAHIFSLVADDGRDQFGYNHVGLYVDCGLMSILGTHAYLLHSGDLPFVLQHLPTLERMIEFFTRRLNAQGLYELPPTGPHWYYDGVNTSGVNAFYNAFLYRAARDLAEIEEAAERCEKGAEYRRMADGVHAAFNKVLWRENAPGGPRYLDWLDADGRELAYFCDLCQWPAVAFGLASPEQARQLIATADARIAQLERELGYRSTASLGALWPIPADLCADGCTWGTGYNGGHGLSPTYWEILARARSGDVAGAARRLERFAQHADKTSWVGNWFNIKDGIEASESYLADMVVVPAALVHGILGIHPSWDRLEVTPHLPPGWSRAEAEVLYKGQRHHVTIEGGRVEVQPSGTKPQTPLLWVMDANLQTLGPARPATGADIDFGDGGSIQLARVADSRSILALWRLDEAEGPVRDAGSYRKHGAVQGEGVQRGQPGRVVAGTSYRFGGKGWVAISGDGGTDVGPYTPHNDSFTFSPWESFTLAGWFKTESASGQTMVANASEYALGTDNGRLWAWLMQDGDHTRHARGRRRVDDGAWHHAVAVCDRTAQRLSLYLDGELDAGDAASGGSNPADISLIRATKWPAGVAIGGRGGQHLWGGWLSEVSIVAGALAPTALSSSEDRFSPCGLTGTPAYVASGYYQSPAYDWAVPAQLKSLTVAADLNGGGVAAMIETSDDGFKTVRSRERITVRDGIHGYALPGTWGLARAVRVRLDLARGADSASTPVVDGFRVLGEGDEEPPRLQSVHPA